MKFNVTADLDWVSGYLRYGHLEGIVDVTSEEELKALIDSGAIRDYLDIVVDDLRFTITTLPKITSLRGWIK